MESTLDKISFLLDDTTPTIVQTICYVGFIGNFFSVIVLSRPQMRNSHLNILLLGLTFADALYLFTSFCRWSGFIWRKLDSYTIIRLFFYFSGQTSSTYLTLVISIERLTVIYWPFRARALFTISTSKWILAIVFAFSLAMSVPDFIIQWLNDWEPYLDFYLNYWKLISLLIRIPIPFLSLLILNTLISIKLRKAAKERATMRNQENESTVEENSITKMLVCVVLVFGTCYSFGFLRDYYVFFFNPFRSGVKRSFQVIPWIFAKLDNITTCVNSSANFFIYIAMGKKFRDEFYRIVTRVFKCTKCQIQSEIVELDVVR